MIGNTVHLAEKEFSPQRGPLIDAFGNVVHHNYADTTISGSTRMAQRKAHRHVRMEREAMERKRLFDVKVRCACTPCADAGTRRTWLQPFARVVCGGGAWLTVAAWRRGGVPTAARNAGGTTKDRDTPGASGAPEEAQARESGERNISTHCAAARAWC